MMWQNGFTVRSPTGTSCWWLYAQRKAASIEGLLVILYSHKGQGAAHRLISTVNTKANGMFEC